MKKPLIFTMVVAFLLAAGMALASPGPRISDVQVGSWQDSTPSSGEAFSCRVTGPSPDDLTIRITRPGGGFTDYDKTQYQTRFVRGAGNYYLVKLTTGSTLAAGNYCVTARNESGQNVSVVVAYPGPNLPAMPTVTAPADMTYVNTLTPTLSVANAGAGVFYQFVIVAYENYMVQIWNSDIVTTNQVTVPAGVLQSQTSYAMFARVMNSQSSARDLTSSAVVRFHTGSGSSPQLSNGMVMTYNSNSGSGETSLPVFVTKASDLAVWNIPGPQITVYDPGNTPANYSLAQQTRTFTASILLASGTPGTTPADGSYTMEVSDGSNGYTESGIGYTHQAMTPIGNTGRSPAVNAYLNTTTPTFTWTPSSAAYYYQVRVTTYTPYSSSTPGVVLWQSSLQQNGRTATVPDGVLLPGATYLWRVQAYTDQTYTNMYGTQYYTFTMNTNTNPSWEILLMN